MLKIILNIQANQVLFHKRYLVNFVAIHEIKPVLTLDKPIYVGFSVLELRNILCMTFIMYMLKKA